MIDDSNLFSELNWKRGGGHCSAVWLTSFGIAASFPALHTINKFLKFIFKEYKYILGYILTSISLNLLRPLYVLNGYVSMYLM